MRRNSTPCHFYQLMNPATIASLPARVRRSAFLLLLVSLVFQASIPSGYMPAISSGNAGVGWLELCGLAIDEQSVDVVVEADGTIHAPHHENLNNRSSGGYERCAFALLFSPDQLVETAAVVSSLVFTFNMAGETISSEAIASLYHRYHSRAPPLTA
jgi:hypothetical protein